MWGSQKLLSNVVCYHGYLLGEMILVEKLPYSLLRIWGAEIHDRENNMGKYKIQ